MNLQHALLAPAISLLLAVTTGCGDDDAIPGGDAPCAAGEISFVGTMGGSSVDASYAYTGAVFSQLGTPSLEVSFNGEGGAAGDLFLTWPSIISDGDQTEVTGTLTWPSPSGATATSHDVAPGSIMTPTEEDKYYFSLDLDGGDHVDGCADMEVF
ncbi:hypothetical protein [Chondromyces crocatus]|uniref:Uncharacterized protein n=1 Tax=Chondromyces crocatus TaxID=52 RepID=A0A0K1EPT2_CHOCO|nr:hypothetical protein [Chondromyces crocatus]AKT42861.1 uncharacterized protein CMC5_070890 [Chondromyces crocatus]